MVDVVVVLAEMPVFYKKTSSYSASAYNAVSVLYFLSCCHVLELMELAVTAGDSSEQCSLQYFEL